MDQAELFLVEVKRILRQGRYDFLGDRRCNDNTLAELGWTTDIMVDFLIDELSPEDLYRKGVEIKDPRLKNKYKRLIACEFKKHVLVEGIGVVELFIRLAKVYGEAWVVIISFHVSR